MLLQALRRSAPAMLMLLVGVGASLGQATAATGASTAQQDGKGVVLDRAVAVVNGDLVLESDVNEEERFSVFQPLSEPAGSLSRRKAVERLINRDLILQQLKLQPEAPVTDKQVDDQLKQLRKELPACRTERCDTDAEWAAFVSKQDYGERGAGAMAAQDGGAAVR